jgi:hypothetical protein
MKAFFRRASTGALTKDVKDKDKEKAKSSLNLVAAAAVAASKDSGKGSSKSPLAKSASQTDSKVVEQSTSKPEADNVPETSVKPEPQQALPSSSFEAVEKQDDTHVRVIEAPVVVAPAAPNFAAPAVADNMQPNAERPMTAPYEVKRSAPFSIPSENNAPLATTITRPEHPSTVQTGTSQAGYIFYPKSGYAFLPKPVDVNAGGTDTSTGQENEVDWKSLPWQMIAPVLPVDISVSIIPIDEKPVPKPLTVSGNDALLKIPVFPKTDRKRVGDNNLKLPVLPPVPSVCAGPRFTANRGQVESVTQRSVGSANGPDSVSGQAMSQFTTISSTATQSFSDTFQFGVGILSSALPTFSAPTSANPTSETNRRVAANTWYPKQDETASYGPPGSDEDPDDDLGLAPNPRNDPSTTEELVGNTATSNRVKFALVSEPSAPPLPSHLPSNMNGPYEQASRRQTAPLVYHQVDPVSGQSVPQSSATNLLPAPKKVVEFADVSATSVLPPLTPTVSSTSQPPVTPSQSRTDVVRHLITIVIPENTPGVGYGFSFKPVLLADDNRKDIARIIVTKFKDCVYDGMPVNNPSVEAGLCLNDVIEAINGKTAASTQELLELIKTSGTSITVSVLRK